MRNGPPRRAFFVQGEVTMAEKIRHNDPGAPVNTPQHLVGEEPAITEGRPTGQTAREGKTRQTGPGTSTPELDVADPHPADEGKPCAARHPGGANPPTNDLGPNPAIHDGSAPARPHNADTGPE
jgi:hypothetical protein